MGTITKALELLTHFSPSRSEIGLAEFVRVTGRDKATLHRHLTELEENGFLEQHPTTRAYRLGPAFLRLAAVREAAFPFRALVRPIVMELADAVGELAHASLLQGDALSSVFHADPQLHGTQVHFDPSEILPLHATSSGVAVLAFADDDLRARVLSRPLPPFTNRTITDPETLRQLVAQTRADGLSRLEGSFDSEVTSQGAPLFGEGDRVVGALSVAVPALRATPDRMDDIARRLRVAAQEASRSLGARAADLAALPDFPKAAQA